MTSLCPQSLGSRIVKRHRVFGISVLLLVCIPVFGTLGSLNSYACDCPFQGDIDASGTHDAVDLNLLLNTMMYGDPDTQDPDCPTTRSDFNGNGFVDVVDLVQLSGYLFLAQAPPADPCTCGYPCAYTYDPPDGNSVVVESKAVNVGETNVTVGVKITNDAPLGSLVAPLAIRELSPGAFISSLKVSFGDRLPATGGPLIEIPITNQYATNDGTCKATGPSGFGTLTNGDTLIHPVTGSPHGILCSRTKVFSSALAPGSDNTGSIILTFDVSSTPGAFEIDTTCTDPSNHLLFVEDIWPPRPIVPSFTKGVVTIGGNAVVVESKSVQPGTTGVEIPIRVCNDVAIRGINIPLVIRELTPGSFITSATMGFRDRLLSNLTDIQIRQQYADEDGACKEQQVGGFGTITYNDGLPHAVGSSPEGFLMAAFRIFLGDLEPGCDTVGSFVLTVDVTSSVGQFEIDTTCTNPANHLLFVVDSVGIPPLFVKGTITIGEPNDSLPVALCSDTVVAADAACSASATLGAGSYDPDGGTVTVIQNPPGPYALGQTVVNVYVIDDENDADTCQAIVTVIDNEPPTVECPGDTSIFNETLSCGASLDFAAPANDNCSLSHVEYTTCDTFPRGATCPDCDSVTCEVIASGHFFPVGATTVECTAWDEAGNTSTCLFVVTVIDTASVLRVCNLNDSGFGSLRSAIDSANTHLGEDTIRFEVAGVIRLLSPLPSLSDLGGGTYIDGLSAPGATWGNPVITLDGSALSAGSGLEIISDDNIIEGLAFRGFPNDGITVVGFAHQNRFLSNLFSRNRDQCIDLGDEGVTPNDDGDVDSGPNDLLNFPVFDSIRELETGLFTVFGTAPAEAGVDLYLAAEYGSGTFIPELNDHGPVYALLGMGVADGSGFFEIDSIAETEWSLITATATDPLGNTSELSRNKSLSADPIRITAYTDQLLIVVLGPTDSTGSIDSIGVSFNSFGTLGVYDQLTDYNEDEIPDTRITIASPDTGLYSIRFVLAPDSMPGEYLTGIGINGHLEATQTVAFSTPDAEYNTTHHQAPPATARGDLDRDGFHTTLDIAILIDYLYFVLPDPPPDYLVDVDCDGYPTTLDLGYLISYTFEGGPMPCLK